MTRRLRVVAGILLDTRGRLLLCKRQNTGRRDGAWSLPGCVVEPCESDEHAIARGMSSELGIEVTVDGVPKVRAEEEGVDMIGFVIRSWHGEARVGDTKHCAGLAWYDASRPPETTPSTELMIAALREHLAGDEEGPE